MFRPYTIEDFVEAGTAHIQTGPFGTQLKASEYVPDGVPVINVRNIGYSDLRADKLEFVTEAKADQLGVHRIEPNDIVFGRKGAVDRHLFVKPEHQGWVQGSDCIRLRITKNAINPRYISYAMLSKQHKKWMLNQCGNKATMASLNQDVVKRIVLRVPDRPVQNEIVAILSAYDNLIENNRRRIGLLEDAARQLYQEWFVRFRFPGHEHVKFSNGVPEGWGPMKLADCVDVVKDAVDPKALEPDTPYIGLEHLPRRSITLAEWETAEKVESGKFRFRKSDIIFGRIRPYFHKVGFALTEGITSSDAIVMRPKDEADWACILMEVSSDRFVALASQTVKEGSKMPRANWDVLKQHILALPPEGLRQTFSDQILSITSQTKALSMAIGQATKARDLLLPKLMSGAIAV